MISIITPVYNAERYLRPCIDSVLAQTLTDWELILIDDESTDCSGAIIDAYSSRDKRIRALHVKNGGPGRARNLGIEACSGEYITFFDADDVLRDDALTVMLDAARTHAADVVVASRICIDSEGNPFHYDSSQHATIDLDNVQYTQKILGAQTLITLWGKLYKRTYIAGKRIDESLHLGEDLLFLLDLFHDNEGQIVEIDERLYFYRMVQGSLSHNKRENKRRWNAKIIDKLILFKSSLSAGHQTAYGSQLSRSIIHFIENDILYQGFVKTINSKQCRQIEENLATISLENDSHLRRLKTIVQWPSVLRTIYLTVVSLCPEKLITFLHHCRNRWIRKA